MEEISEKNKNGEKSAPKVAAMTGQVFDELQHIDWSGIPDSSYIMKYRFLEDGYMLMVSNLAAVYGEKLDEESIQRRFQILNPYAEMLPKVILKHVEQSARDMLAGEQACGETVIKMNLESNKVTIQCQFNISGVHFIFNFEPQKLSDNQFKLHILRPTFLKGLMFDEEKATLQRKVEELEGRQNSSSSNNGIERRNIKALYSEIKRSDPPASSLINAFLYLQQAKIILPESLGGITNVSPHKGVRSSDASSSLHNRKKESKNIANKIPYKEDDSVASPESQNIIQKSVPRVSILEIDNVGGFFKTEDMNDFGEPVLYLPKQESNSCVSPMKREMVEEDREDDSAAKPTPYLKPSPSKKKKILKF